eukprot:gene13421-13549_t
MSKAAVSSSCRSDHAVLPSTNTGRHLLQPVISDASSSATGVSSTRGSSKHETTAAGDYLHPSASSQVYNSSESLANPSDFSFLAGAADYTVQLVNTTTGTNVSAWHNIPLDLESLGDGTSTFYMMVEIPLSETAKYETQTRTPGNPVKQDKWEAKDANATVISTRPRYYLYGPSLVNYGALPQTWSNSNTTDTLTGLPGDNDPLDVLDISSIRGPLAGIYKLLGALAMVDSNRTDWKVVAINTKDFNATKYSDIGDVPKERLMQILDFFANYKQAENKTAACFWPADAAASAAQCKLNSSTIADQSLQFFHNKSTALQVIKRYHDAYKWLLAGNCQSDKCKELWLPDEAATSPPAAG